MRCKLGLHMGLWDSGFNKTGVLVFGVFTIRLQFKAFAGRVNVGHSNYLGPYSQQGGPERNCPFGPQNFVMLAVL